MQIVKIIFENRTSFLLLSLTTQTEKSLLMIHTLDHKPANLFSCFGSARLLCQRSIILALWSHHKDGSAIIKGIHSNVVIYIYFTRIIFSEPAQR